ncbi:MULTISPECIES: DUF5412 family protein [Bacillus]|uniref:DUF5412 family protein n=1 Tax=Bacillus TaxID=1386 RepID=UPI000497B39A|nr:DUF5412 family protein [Bacillus sonorensis]MCY8033649.1 DUF5412 domain-containing protein [Bacillus sonorensis]MCY8086295.1 DUF5412 domain-containing protein [Bacillus sonorensis]MCY8562335.1 DUF5412 domain-containing protein [Bacillus sonorensis]MEC1500320.1 DUF5412 family protein [Bacillus sonorensis]MEC1588785.1 DUF5412 family protein [Bacillus sonorensis]
MQRFIDEEWKKELKEIARRNTLFTLLAFILALGIPIGYVVYTQFYSMNHLPKGVQLMSLTSPNQTYTISIYRTPKRGNAAGFSIRGELTTASSGERRNIYWGDKADHPKVEWKDENHVSINDKVLDVRSDTYDWRRE